MRVIVCGGRSYDDQMRVEATLNSLNVTELAHGACRRWKKEEQRWVGADWFGWVWANRTGRPSTAFKAEWKILGRSAGPIRNRRMLSEFKPDLVVAFPGGAGTADMITAAREAGVEVMEVAA